MLEFIVLGQVPGTHIYINFTEALIMWALVLMTIHTLLKYRQYQKLLADAEQSALYLAVIKKQRRASRRKSA